MTVLIPDQSTESFLFVLDYETFYRKDMAILNCTTGIYELFVYQYSVLSTVKILRCYRNTRQLKKTTTRNVIWGRLYRRDVE